MSAVVNCYRQIGTSVEQRDFNDPKYKKWRKRVYIRDRWACKMPGCAGMDKKLNAHHIKKWAGYPALRYVISNGITLCRACHDRIWGSEEEYESLFLHIVNQPRSDISLMLLMMRYAQKPPEGG